jgi:hypothetical protein
VVHWSTGPTVFIELVFNNRTLAEVIRGNINTGWKCRFDQVEAVPEWMRGDQGRTTIFQKM